jgi:DNA-binding transcriptional regulator YhcF (GntR family)
MLIKTPTRPLAEQLAARLSERIQTGLLAPGARLPSVRQCAQQQGVSPSTVVAAYDQLLAQGLVEAQKNRGFYIRNRSLAQNGQLLPAMKPIVDQSADTARPALAATPQHVPVNATALIRGMFQGSRPAATRHGCISAGLAGNHFLSAACAR